MELTEAWRAFKDEALAVPIDETARRFPVKLRINGSDLIGHCPAGCTVHGDGFIISPKKGKGIFLCRPSGETGDGVDMVRHAMSLDGKDGFAEACEFITGKKRPDGGQTDEEQLRLDEEKRRERIQKMREGLERHRRAEAAKKRGTEIAIADLMARACPIEGTQAEVYLRARGCAPVRRLTGDLRYLAEVDYWGFAESAEEYYAKNPDVDPKGHPQPKVYLTTAPAMLGLIRDSANDVTALHVTYLDPSGGARKLEPPGDRDRNGAKKFRGSPKGGLIRLGLMTNRVAIGEGIETVLGWAALSVTLDDGLSFAAAGSLGNLYGKCTRSKPHPTRRIEGRPVWVPNGIPDMEESGCVLPDDVTEVTLLGDADSERIATRLKLSAAVRRFMSQGRKTYVHYCVNGADWADVAQARAEFIATEGEMASLRALAGAPR
jgi:hypothetical protein